MSYLRIIAPARTRRRARRPCLSCEKDVYRFEAFCPYCGLAHTAFDKALFETLARTSLADARRECVTDASHALERIARAELGDDRLRWCTECGVRLPEGELP